MKDGRQSKLKVYVSSSTLANNYYYYTAATLVWCSNCRFSDAVRPLLKISVVYVYAHSLKLVKF